MPASGPMPRANVNTAAKTSVGIARANVIIARPIANTTEFGVDGTVRLARLPRVEAHQAVQELALLAQGSGWLAVVALLVAHVTSRTVPLVVIRTLAHVGDTPQSKSKPLAESLSNTALLAGLVWWALAMALAWWLLPGAPWWAGVLGALVGLAWMWRLLHRRLQGFTGDGLGATQQVSEVLFYLGLALALPAMS